MKEVFEAVEDGDVVAFQVFVANDSDVVHSVNTEGDTLLHIACWQKHLLLVPMLCGMGVDVNARGCYGRTALHYAVHEGDELSLPIVQCLIDYRADITIRDDMGNTPEDWARVEMGPDALDVIEIMKRGRKVGPGS